MNTENQNNFILILYSAFNTPWVDVDNEQLSRKGRNLWKNYVLDGMQANPVVMHFLSGK